MKTIQELRKERGWTQLELSRRMNVTPSTVYSWESRKHLPNAIQFRELIRVFDFDGRDIALTEEETGTAARLE